MYGPIRPFSVSIQSPLENKFGAFPDKLEVTPDQHQARVSYMFPSIKKKQIEEDVDASTEAGSEMPFESNVSEEKSSGHQKREVSKVPFRAEKMRRLDDTD